MAKSSQIFAFSRLKLTIKKEWGENRRQFLLLILFITGAMSIESFLQISSAYNKVEYLYMTTGGENVDFHTAAQQHFFYERYHYMQHVLFAIILVSFTALAASLAFSSTSTKDLFYMRQRGIPNGKIRSPFRPLHRGRLGNRSQRLDFCSIRLLHHNEHAHPLRRLFPSHISRPVI